MHDSDLLNLPPPPPPKALNHSLCPLKAPVPSVSPGLQGVGATSARVVCWTRDAHPRHLIQAAPGNFRSQHETPIQHPSHEPGVFHPLPWNRSPAIDFRFEGPRGRHFDRSIRSMLSRLFLVHFPILRRGRVRPAPGAVDSESVGGGAGCRLGAGSGGRLEEGDTASIGGLCRL